MPHRIFKKIIKAELTPSEKEKVFNVLKEFVKENPKENVSPWYTRWNTAIDKSILSPFQSEFFVKHQKVMSSYATIALFLIVVTGGTMLSAKPSLPGEILYPVKVGLNEPLESFVSISAEQKIDTEFAHINNRLTEAEQLQEQNKLNDKQRATIETSINKSLENTAKQTIILNKNGKTNEAVRAVGKVKESLREHATIINNILKHKDNRTDAQPEIQKTSKIKSEVQFMISEHKQEESSIKVTADSTTTPSTQKATTTKDKIENLILKLTPQEE